MLLEYIHSRLTCPRMGLAQNWRRRGKFEEVAFIFPNAPSIPVTVVSNVRRDLLLGSCSKPWSE